MAMDQIKVEKEWKERGFSCGLWIDPPGQLWENFRHETDELFMVVEGDVEIEMNGKVQRPKIGEEILIPANTVHTVRNAGRKTSRWLYGYKKKSAKP